MINVRNVFVASMLCVVLSSCMGGAASSGAGGELTGVGMMAWAEPTPYGMVLVGKGSMKIGGS